jgi:hypothetical protein
MTTNTDEHDRDDELLTPPLLLLLTLTIGLFMAIAVIASHAAIAVLSVVLLGALLITALFVAAGPARQ